MIKLFTLSLLIASAIGGETSPKPWSRVGTAEQVQISENTIVLNTPEAVSIGALSSSVELSGADSVLLKANVANAGIRSITLAAQNTQSGQTIGYWQNSIPVGDETEIATVLPLAERVSAIRIFAGTHDRPSEATIRDVRAAPVRQGPANLGSIYAAIVDGRKEQAQTFKAAGRLVAVTIRARHVNPGQTSNGLLVRIVEWKPDTGQRGSDSLAEVTVPASRISAGVEGNERDVTIAINAPTKAGKSYALCFSSPGSTPEEAIFLWAGPDQYANGNRFENDQPHQDWDLYFETYHE
jgi:hypothetical protein